MLYGSSGLPLPPPNLGGSERFCHQIHPHCSRCLPARLPKRHFHPSTLGSEGVEGHAVWHRSRLLLNQKRRSSPYGWMLGPSRISSLRTIGSFSKRKKKSSPYGPHLPGTFHCVGLCVDAHCPKHLEKGTRPLPTTVASVLTPPDRWSLLPYFHKASSQLQY